MPRKPWNNPGKLNLFQGKQILPYTVSFSHKLKEQTDFQKSFKTPFGTQDWTVDCTDLEENRLLVLQ